MNRQMASQKEYSRDNPPELGWDHPSYRVRVRQLNYLWGSAGVAQNINFPSPLILHVRNDELGEQVTFGTETAGGTQSTIGTLNPGECISIPLQNITGVFASCTLNSTVSCFIRTS